MSDEIKRVTKSDLVGLWGAFNEVGYREWNDVSGAIIATSGSGFSQQNYEIVSTSKDGSDDDLRFIACAHEMFPRLLTEIELLRDELNAANAKVNVLLELIKG